MTRTRKLCGTAALLSGMVLVAFSEPLWGHMGDPVAVNKTFDVDRAKEMAGLIEKGQMNLRDASSLAEKHVKGTALDAACEIQPGGGGLQPMSDDLGAAKPPDKKTESDIKPAERRLVYAITCFSKDRLQKVAVDGLTKKVIDVQDQTDPKPSKPMDR